MGSYQDAEFPHGRRIMVGQGQWGVSGNVSTTIGGREVTELIHITAAPGVSYKGKRQLFLPKDDLKRAVAKGQFEKDYPDRNPY